METDGGTPNNNETITNAPRKRRKRGKAKLGKSVRGGTSKKHKTGASVYQFPVNVVNAGAAVHASTNGDGTTVGDGDSTAPGPPSNTSAPSTQKAAKVMQQYPKHTTIKRAVTR